jgi:hypothetical protein
MIGMNGSIEEIIVTKRCQFIDGQGLEVARLDGASNLSRVELVVIANERGASARLNVGYEQGFADTGEGLLGPIDHVERHMARK